MKGLTLSVTQLNEYVRKTLASDPMLRKICLRGEISNLKKHVSGHWYFTLKDEDAAINCAMFRSAAQTVRFSPQNGQQVRLFGSVGLYSKTGSYQFYGDAMERDGLGDLYLRFEALKEKLAGEGLFDASLKKPMPLLPKGVGVITSKTGAVVHDITRVTWRRNPSVSLYLCPVKVQGDGAAEEIAKAIKLMDQVEDVELLIIGRGGGSMEDLWAFNEEVVARAISKCKKPIVSAVGHETDFTIADFVADLRAATPSAAAEMVVPELSALKDTVDLMTARMTQAFESDWSMKRMRLMQLDQKLIEHSPMQQSERLLSRIRELLSRMDAQAESLLQKRMHALKQATLGLRLAGPINAISQGYAVMQKNGKVIKNIKDIQIGDDLNIMLSGGSIHADVTSIEDKGEASWLQRQ